METLVDNQINHGEMVSVIVPVYNVEQYLPKCIESLINQTYKNIQIILVDDGSTDQSGKICDAYAERDSRIEVVHQANGGVSKARNQGIELANGKYIAFCDADDWVEPDMYEYLYGLLATSKCNIASCGAWMESPKDKMAIGYSRKQNLHLDVEESIVQMHLRRCMSDWVVTKLFDGKIIHALRYDESLTVCEDYKFECEAIESSQGVVCGTEVKYHYIQRKSSVSNNGYTSEFEKGLAVREVFLEKYAKEYPDRKREIAARYMLEIMGILTAMIKGDCIDKDRKNEIVTYIRQNLWSYLLTKGPDLYLKGSAVVIAVNFNLFSAIYKKLKAFS